jgi:thiol:disulfide interchange protein
VVTEGGLLSENDVRDALADFVRLRIDATERDAAAFEALGQWRATALPTFIFLDRSGREMGRHVGAPPREWLLTMARAADD